MTQFLAYHLTQTGLKTQSIQKGRGAVPKRLFMPAPQPTRSFVWQVSGEFTEDTRLSKTAKDLLLNIFKYAGVDCNTTAGRTTLARKIGRSVRTVSRCIQELKTLGYITVFYMKSKTGAITGWRLWINDRTKAYFHRKDYQKQPQSQYFIDVPKVTVNNKTDYKTYIDLQKPIKKDADLDQKLSKLSHYLK